MLTETASLMLALDYLERHFFTRYIFPIKTGAKFPPCLRDNLDTNCSCDPEQIKRWSKQFPGCNWGLAHKKSRLLVADIDTNPKKNKQGQVTYDALDLMYGWPETEKTTTPSGGFHLIYEGPHITAYGKNGIGLDIDSPNYTLIPGCTFADGTGYVTNDAPSVECPQWIYDTIKNAKASARIKNADEIVVDLDQPTNIELAIDFLKEDAEPAIEGRGGDITTYKTAAYLKDIGISATLAIELLNEYYNPRCEPPWDLDGLERKVASAYTYTNLSKGGGKTAEADFTDDPPDDNFPTKGNSKKIAYQKREREAVKAGQTGVASDKKERDVKPSDLINEWVWVTGNKRFIEKSNLSHVWDKEQFNSQFNYVLGEKSTKNISEVLLRKRKGSIPRFKRSAYKPSLPQRIDSETFNLYQPPAVKPVQGDVSWWDDHLEYLFPDEADRSLVLDWISWLLQNLGQKPKHALLVQGTTQGTGKSFIVEILELILDRRNVAHINQIDLHGDFNGWAEKSKLLAIEELRAIDRNEVANKLHPLITQEMISINEKNMPRRDVENCFGIFAMSNHDAAVMLDQSDRRYLVVTTLATPRYGKDTPQSIAYYTSLYNRRFDPASVAAVAYQLMNRDVGAYTGAGSAPQTAAKTSMIEAGLPDIEHYILDNSGNFPFSGKLISVDDVTLDLPKRLVSHGGRQYATIRSILIRRLGAIDVGQCPLPGGGRRVRLMAIGPKAAMLALQDKKTLGALYEADKAKANKCIPLDDSAGSEFGETTED